jgi:hypothetical protein
MNFSIFYIFFILIFLLNPFCGAILIWIFYLLDNKIKTYDFLVIIMALMVTLINLTKVIENDLLYHSGEYLLSKNLSFSNYISYKGKEPVYYSFNYICYHLTNGSIKIWLFLISFSSYCFFLRAIVKVLVITKATRSQILLGIILGVYFPQLFSLSAHLLRQFIVSSLFIWFAVDYIYYKKNRWWICVFAFFIHSSSIILFPLIYFRKLGDFKNHSKINLLIIFVLLSYQFISMLLLKVVGSIGFVGYALTRASSDTTYDLGEFNWINYILLIFMGYGSLKIMKSMKAYTVENKHFFSVMLALSVFILVNINQSELSSRMFFYLFSFFPIIVPMLLSKKNISFREINILISISFIFFFIFRLENGTWKYAPTLDLFCFTIYNYFIY